MYKVSEQTEKHASIYTTFESILRSSGNTVQSKTLNKPFTIFNRSLLQAVPETDHYLRWKRDNHDELSVYCDRPSDFIKSDLLTIIANETIKSLKLNTNCDHDLKHMPSVGEWQELFQSLRVLVKGSIKSVILDCVAYPASLFFALSSCIWSLCTKDVKKLEIRNANINATALAEFKSQLEAGNWRVIDKGDVYTYITRKTPVKMIMKFQLNKCRIILPIVGYPQKWIKVLEEILNPSKR